MSIPVVFQQSLVSGFHICSPNILRKGGENLFLRKVGATHKKVCIEGTDQYFLNWPIFLGKGQFYLGLTNILKELPIFP